MESEKYHRIENIQIISAPSILGLKPTGVENLGEGLLACGLAEKLNATNPVIIVPDLNHLYNSSRDPDTDCLNATPIREFSLALSQTIADTIANDRFALVLGGDCSILLGIMPALKAKETQGLVFIDAHADFYEPGQSITGEVADMDLAIVTGRGPELLTNINNLCPYVNDENIAHIGQRDHEETKQYGSRDIRETAIKCIPLADIENRGIKDILPELLQYIRGAPAERFWIHFDTDSLSDEINPAVDYRLPGGLSFEQTELLLQNLFSTGKITGMSVTIFNPSLDKEGHIARNITESLGRSFKL